VSQKTSHLWLAITLDTREWILICFGRKITRAYSNWQNKETRKLHFHSNAVLVHCQHLTSRCLISSIFLTYKLQLILTLLYDSLNLVINAFISGLLGSWFTINEVESTVAVGLCCTHNAPVRCLLGFLFCKVMPKH